MDENQTPTEAAAESYAVSADGLTYTFLLRKDMLWSDGKTPVTAYDFQFAFQRLFDPQTQSPAAVNFTCIRGSSAALSGEGSVQDIGVTAQDDDTLVFSLEHLNPSFLSLLTTPAALPCNEDFFRAARGKYSVRRFTLRTRFHLWPEASIFHAEKHVSCAGFGHSLLSGCIFGRKRPVPLTDGAVTRRPFLLRAGNAGRNMGRCSFPIFFGPSCPAWKIRPLPISPSARLGRGVDGRT
ncbi:MAG: ABC transporter substrate-binding protein [[Clostridium] leptum]